LYALLILFFYFTEGHNINAITLWQILSLLLFVQVIANGNKAFTYDYVFNSVDTQEYVYKTSVSPLIDGIFKGRMHVLMYI